MKEKNSVATIDNPSFEPNDHCPISYEPSYSFGDIATQVGGLKFREVKKVKQKGGEKQK